MQNRPRPHLQKMFRKLRSIIAVAPVTSGGSRLNLEDLKSREVQLELDFRPRGKQPWIMMD